MATVQKNIRWEEKLLENLNKRAEKLGMSFSEYVKYCVVKDLEENK